MIEFRHVHKHYGKFEVLKDINLKVNQGDVMVIVGNQARAKVHCCVASIGWRKSLRES